MTTLRSIFDDQVLEAQIPLTLDSYTKWTIPILESAMIYIGTQNLTNSGTITVTGDLLVLTSGGTLTGTGTITGTGNFKLMEL